MSTFVIIPAAGKSIRAGFPIPKQFLKFNNKELLVHTCEVFQNSPLVDKIIIATNEEYVHLVNSLVESFNLTKVCSVIVGGKERQDSVYNALRTIEAGDGDIVAVHDAARPLLSQEVLTTAITTAQEKGTALVCMKTKDTILSTSEGEFFYPDRSHIYQVQTPQVFAYSLLKEAFEKAYEDSYYGTDESMLVKRLGAPIELVEGNFLNFKVTTKEDVELIGKLL